MKMRKCELCNAAAAVFCPSDAAFLCSTCDAKVHQANFLVARHLRRLICSHCNSFTPAFVSGPVAASRPSCPSCPQEKEEDDEDGPVSSSTSSSCVSSTTTSPDCSRRRRTWRSSKKAEGIFVNWCGKLGVVERESGTAVAMACKGMRACVNRLPLRVSLAASMWLGLRLTQENKSWKLLKRLEEISGVPAKIILAAESKLARAVSVRGSGGGGGGGGEVVDDHERLVEGWAETEC